MNKRKLKFPTPFPSGLDKQEESSVIKITIEVEITPQQSDILPYDIEFYLERAALRELGSILRANCETDTPIRSPLPEHKDDAEHW